MTYQEVVEYLFSQLPYYQRDGAPAYKPDIGNIVKLCDLLGNPQTKFKSVHIAGTNGKGSVSHMVASVCQEAGLKTGLYTSPHLLDFRERVKINGEPISETAVIEFVIDHQKQFNEIKPSFFEWTVALAFNHFANEQVDIAIVETGLGGRLDSTNILNPEVCAITSIGLDHTKFLGDTIEKIAAEKAGIIKDNTPVVIGKLPPNAVYVIEEKAEQHNSSVLERSNRILKTDLKGKWQSINAQVAEKMCEVLREIFPMIGDPQIEAGLLNVKENTGLRGRWEVFGDDPLTICDIGHNQDAFTYILNEIKSIDHNQLFMVLGFANDKAVDDVLKMLPKDAKYIACQANINRAMQVEELQEKFNNYGLEVTVEPDCKGAMEKARSKADPGDLVFVGGSAFVVAEVIE